MQLSHTILYGLRRINGERTTASIYHLLKGKRSSQTLQDGTVYGLSFLFGIYKKLSRQVYDELIHQLLNLNQIVKIEENTFLLSSLGEAVLTQALHVSPFPPKLNGLVYKDVTEIVWRRLSLLIQTVSYLQTYTSFLPVQQDHDTTSWVRTFLFSLPYSREQVRDKIYEEILKVLGAVPDEDAAQFVFRLTGTHRVGLTSEQLALYYHQDSFQVHLSFLGTLHYLISRMEQDNEFSLLKALIPERNDFATILSVSAQKTYMLWKNGREIEEMAALRGLKQNTIEDHLVEIAMHVPSFQIDHFVSDDKIKRIRTVIREMNTRKLRVLKEYVGTDIDYFSIRLVLAALGGASES